MANGYLFGFFFSMANYLSLSRYSIIIIGNCSEWLTEKKSDSKVSFFSLNTIVWWKKSVYKYLSVSKKKPELFFFLSIYIFVSNMYLAHGSCTCLNFHIFVSCQFIYATVSFFSPATHPPLASVVIAILKIN